MDINLIPTSGELDNLVSPDDQIVLMSEAARRAKLEKKGQDKFPIGYSIFNEVMNGGITAGDLVVISGKSGEGKTTFAQTLTWHINKLSIPQLWFSYEMEITEIWEKFETMGVDEFFMGYCPLKIRSGNIEWIERKIVESVLKFNTKVIFIDHLGFLLPKSDDQNYESMNRNYSVYLGSIARQLKDIAREKHLIIFLLAHVRKTRDELTLDDLAHSSGIGQEADFVFMVERERQKTKWEKTEGDVYTPFTKISLVKNRRTGINKFIRCQLTAGKLTEAVNYEVIG